jgi:hypothetical protein
MTAWMFISAGTILAFAALVLAVHLENRRDDRSDHQPPRRVTAIRARAGGTRRRATGSMRRRARTTRAWAVSWFWWHDPLWQAAAELVARGNTWGRRAITRRIRRFGCGYRLIRVEDDPGPDWEAINRDLAERYPSELDEDDGEYIPEDHRADCMFSYCPGCKPPEPGRKATDAERRDAGLCGPLYSWETGEFAAAIGDTP